MVASENHVKQTYMLISDSTYFLFLSKYWKEYFYLSSDHYFGKKCFLVFYRSLTHSPMWILCWDTILTFFILFLILRFWFFCFVFSYLLQLLRSKSQETVKWYLLKDFLCINQFDYVWSSPSKSEIWSNAHICFIFVFLGDRIIHEKENEKETKFEYLRHWTRLYTVA